MFGAERRQRLLELVGARGAVSIRELSDALDASEATVRRDVTTLANRGVLVHSHGGAMVPGQEQGGSALHDLDRATAGAMFGAQRRRLICEVVSARKAISLRELAKAVNASEATVRRDLVTLERRGLLLRSHGGASIPDALDVTPWPQLSSVVAAKTRIGALAATLVGDSDAIMLGSGTTVQAFARQLAPRSRLIVLTNSILVARALAKTPHVDLVMTGGALDGSAHALIGESAERWVAEHRVSRGFISGSGLTTDKGLSGSDAGLSAVDRAIVESAKSVTVLADRTKIGIDSVYDIAPISRISGLVTDGSTDDRVVQSLSARGVAVHTTPPEPALAS